VLPRARCPWPLGKSAHASAAQPLELRRVLVADEEQELERLGETNVLELRGGGESFDEVAVIERAAKAWPD
jgi:hypothetical protein